MRYLRARRGAVVTMVAPVLILFVVGTADAADVTNSCTGTATSYDGKGSVVDNARAPGAGGTQSNPFMLDGTGSVAWRASTPVVITTGEWSVGIAGATVLSGRIDNKDARKTTSGVTAIGDLPVAARTPIQWLLLGGGKLPVTAEVTGSGQSCSGTVWITGIGSPTGSPLFWMGAGVLLIAMILLIWLIGGTTEILTSGVGVAGAAGGPDDGVGPHAERISGTGVT